MGRNLGVHFVVFDGDRLVLLPDRFPVRSAKLKNVPLMMEHLKTTEEYVSAAEYVRSVGKTLNIEL